ncbi:hypothetical protein [Methanoculleus chikugoensis]|uniref:hypothetical protein n=1 Tax=Methanoculleus chikugoensis TaxID=118126 RepID=UPI001FB1B75D|nr:hypothetical protein [Methanoculleus chikugoensis]
MIVIEVSVSPTTSWPIAICVNSRTSCRMNGGILPFDSRRMVVNPAMYAPTRRRSR